MIKGNFSTGFTILVLVLTFVAAPVSNAWAVTAKEIDAGVEATLDMLYDEVGGSKKMVKEAKGVLVFPSVIKAGFGLGGEFGEGALRINGKTVDYYNTAGVSIGFQIGAQKKRLVILFLEKEALDKFRSSTGWKAGVDASVAVVAVGAEGTLESYKYKEPIVAFVIGQKGLMYDVSLEGAKFTKIDKS